MADDGDKVGRPQIIFINRYFYPDHSATSQMLSELAFGLAAEGERVTVLTSRQLYENAAAQLVSGQTIRGVAVMRLWSSSFGRLNLVGRAFDYVSFYLSVAVTLLWLVRRGDIVVAKTDPPLLSVIVAPITALKGAHLVNWLQDIFPEAAAAIYAPNPIIRGVYGVLRWLRTVSLKSAVTNVVLGRRMRDRVQAFGVKPDQITVIPNWANGTLITPIEPQSNPLRREWGLDGTFTVGYSGNLGRAHEYETFIDAISRTEQAYGAPTGETTAQSPLQIPKIRWLFVGGGALSKAFQARCHAAGLVHVMFRPYQPSERLAESLSAADVHLVSLLPDLEGLIVPSKYYGVAAAGRPAIFIGAADGEVAGILADRSCGVTVAPGDGTALAEAVYRLAANPALCREMGNNARRAFDQEFSFDTALRSWTELINQTAARRPSTQVPPNMQSTPSTS